MGALSEGMYCLELLFQFHLVGLGQESHGRIAMVFLSMLPADASFPTYAIAKACCQLSGDGPSLLSSRPAMHTDSYPAGALLEQTWLYRVDFDLRELTIENPEDVEKQGMQDNRPREIVDSSFCAFLVAAEIRRRAPLLLCQGQSVGFWSCFCKQTRDHGQGPVKSCRCPLSRDVLLGAFVSIPSCWFGSRICMGGSAMVFLSMLPKADVCSYRSQQKACCCCRVMGCCWLSRPSCIPIAICCWSLVGARHGSTVGFGFLLAVALAHRDAYRSTFCCWNLVGHGSTAGFGCELIQP
ncbi:hypothetical protein Nepgr_032607 [Nepenthes gracilis]|uniref:Uncharacterized protein n=1 Tax=Nepenthes gracilis TaxID=150966 RepID=A0AAD3Y807_NEPGR|nr:hypothetical protein Nepgr_032607 [Nepenthes gracilis]